MDVIRTISILKHRCKLQNSTIPTTYMTAGATEILEAF